MQEAWVRSLVGELRFHVACVMAKKEEETEVDEQKPLFLHF